MKWIDATKDNVKGRLVDIQILVTAIMPPDIPRLYFVMARTIPFGMLCKAPKIPAILKALDTLVMTTLTANPPTDLGGGMRTFSRSQQITRLHNHGARSLGLGVRTTWCK